MATIISYARAQAALVFALLSLPLFSQKSLTLRAGMTIESSCVVERKDYRIDPPRAYDFAPPFGADTARAAIVIRGEDIVVDFQNASLIGADDPTRPDAFCGLALRIEGRRITLRNARIRGYKVAVLALGVENLRLENCDFSYNYRPRLYSGREQEDERDWLYYHHNEQDEWLRYGAGAYLRDCRFFVVKNCRATANQNALLLHRCEGGLIYNNTFQFNSGLGIGMYRSSANKVMHNRLDWNVRGYSHGFYARGQDSAAILVYEQSNDNLFAYNSCTHSGDGFFLWAGQYTMDTGQGGCNDNYLFGNDFSHAPTNGVELTFSRNKVQGNLISDCTHGIWAGYSYNSVFSGNLISECRTGIAIEHGQDNLIRFNLFSDDTVGVKLWARASQPADWGYPRKRDTRSRHTTIDRNVFLNTRTPLAISNSDSIEVNGENLFYDFETLLRVERPNRHLRFLRNDVYALSEEAETIWAHPELAPARRLNSTHLDLDPPDPYAPLQIPIEEISEPDSLQGGMNAGLPPGFPRGRQFILVDEWGPYDFQRPVAALDYADAQELRITLLGPSGDWRLIAYEGLETPTAIRGIVPAELHFKRLKDAPPVRLTWEYSSPQRVADAFGRRTPPGEKYLFSLEYPR